MGQKGSRAGNAPETGVLRRSERLLARRGGAVELLRLPAALFGVAAGLRSRLYDRGWLGSARLEVPVVSVGNLTAGGTGKTPMVIWLARRLAARGRFPGLLSRGYGAPRDAASEGDEARMLAAALPDVPSVQNPDRIAGARELLGTGVDVVILDDGFQHRRLQRDLDLVLVDATRPWGLPRDPGGAAPVRALLPRGLLREKPAALARADALIVTRTDQVPAEDLERLLAELHRIAPGPAVAHAVHGARGLVDPEGAELEPTVLAGREVDLLSAIGNPESFEETVRSLGAQVGTHRALRDHGVFEPADLAGLGRDGRWIVTTAKDAVKLRPLLGDDAKRSAVHVLEVELEIVRSQNVLEALLDSLPPGRSRRERQSLHEGLHG